MTETPESRTEPAAMATEPRPAELKPDRPNRLGQVAALVGIVAGVVFIVAVSFFSSPGSSPAETPATPVVIASSAK